MYIINNFFALTKHRHVNYINPLNNPVGCEWPLGKDVAKDSESYRAKLKCEKSK